MQVDEWRRVELHCLPNRGRSRALARDRAWLIRGVGLTPRPRPFVLPSAIPNTLRLPPLPATVCYLAAAGVLAVGYFLNESTCLWRAMTGLPCPGCGMIHAFLSLAQGNLGAAWEFNPGSVVAATILVWAGIRRVKELC